MEKAKKKEEEKNFEAKEEKAEIVAAVQGQTGVKENASSPFDDVLNIKRRETKSKKANFLLTETNFNHLVELSKETGASRNELINRLIDSCYKNSRLS